ncbi:MULTISPECIES: hypothetical protein [unclassified Pseudoalteromonas]|uniref:hypothetical protein n=1 Tax=unclassified Pseudoalteromonas TaxID=194690 RepID=UPI000403729D|nr:MULTISPECIES: hypothetical protein [unclassified Pseudoalteromonas]
MTENKFDIYNPVINELVSESINCSPDSWEKGRLSIDCDGRAINYKLKNSDSPDSANISDSLRQLAEQLYVTMRQNGDTWTEAFIDFFVEDDSWNFKVQFEYEENV